MMQSPQIAIEKTKHRDFILIDHKFNISMTYDHKLIDDKNSAAHYIASIL